MITALLVGGLLIAVFLLVIILYRILDALADNDIFLTKVEPGQAKFILRGGTFEEAIMGDRDRVFDPEWNIIKYANYLSDEEREQLCCDFIREYKKGDDGEVREILRVQRRIHLLERLFGWRWVGFFRRVDEYHFKWTEVEQRDGVLSVRPREGDTRFIFVRAFTYGSILKELETADRLPLDVAVLVTAMIINPVKARFRVDDWLQRIMGLVDTSTRRFVSENEYNDVLIEQRRDIEGDGDPKTGLWHRIQKDYECEGHEGGFPDEHDHDAYLDGIKYPDRELIKEIGGDDRCIYFRKYGVLIDVVEILSIEFGGPNANELVDAATAEYREIEKAKALRAKAEGERDAEVLRAEGGAAYVAQVIDPVSKLGAGGVLAYGADSISKGFGRKDEGGSNE